MNVNPVSSVHSLLFDVYASSFQTAKKPVLR